MNDNSNFLTPMKTRYVLKNKSPDMCYNPPKVEYSYYQVCAYPDNGFYNVRKIIYNESYQPVDKYKGEINQRIYERDQRETEALNEVGQPKLIYNNFPLILGAIFIIVGIVLILITDKSNLYYQTPFLEEEPK